MVCVCVKGGLWVWPEKIKASSHKHVWSQTHVGIRSAVSMFPLKERVHTSLTKRLAVVGALLGAESAGTPPTTHCSNFWSPSTSVCVCVCVRGSASVWEFPVCAKYNTHTLLAPRHAGSCPQLRVFQMNNTPREKWLIVEVMKHLTCGQPESKIGFISWMWRRSRSRLNRSAAAPSPPGVMQWTCSAQNRLAV